MKIMEARSIVVIILGALLLLIGMLSGVNAENLDSFYFCLFLDILGTWLVFAGWSAYALIGKEYRPGFANALAFFTIIGVVIAYLLPSKREHYSKNKYMYLEKIAKLKEIGELTEHEYEIEKMKIMEN